MSSDFFQEEKTMLERSVFLLVTKLEQLPFALGFVTLDIFA